MAAMHAVQKMLAEHSRPPLASVDAGEFLEIEPDVFSVIISFNPTEAEHLVRDLEELGATDLPLRDSIVAFSDHGAPAANSSIATGHKRWQVRNLGNGKTIAANPLPEFFRDMTAAGGEKAYLKARIARERSAVAR